ncbi:serine/threonine-protein kinase [Actinoplanes sp. NPDC020271]|uniref:serine/threonine-protein kinase n=1 Tax=Actinoplanes sp. NPDC020271 TaxID=3363896 RepID=UPI0037990BE2
MQPNFGLGAGMRLGGRYRLDNRLGAGGMGEVWQGFDESLNRVVAIKTMLPAAAQDPDFVQRFAAEAHAMARVNHPNVAAIHDVGQNGGRTYLVMEFIDGESLAQRLVREGRLSPAETKRIVIAAAEGLQAVHDQGILHRDVKPANIMLRSDGGVLITDFGIARHLGSPGVTATGAVLGTPGYLAPEQVLGQPADRRSDVYSLGLVAYECLAGQKPFVGDNPYAVALQRIQQEPRTLGADVPPAVLALVERALQTDPEKRFPSALAMAEVARQADLASPSGTGRTAGKKNPRVLIGAVAAVVVIALIVAGIVARGGNDDPRGAAAAGEPTATAAAGGAPTGFTACGDAFCPDEPLCWAGLTQIGTQAVAPVSRYCPGSHVWETFAAITLPAGPPVLDSTSPLIKQPDVAKACSAQVMAAQSLDPATTKGWRRDAWPVQGSNGWLLHCMAQPAKGSSVGAAFKK